MPFAYYDRLSAARRAIYRRSDAITTLGLPQEVEAGDVVNGIRLALERDDRPRVQQGAQGLVDLLVAGYRVPPIRMRVLARRPTDEYGELHGLYEPGEGRRRARITVWMRTAKRRQVVAFRSFLRTIVHEVVHHLDYELFMLDETFHTEGFYKREASVSHALLAQAGAVSGDAAPAAPRARP